MATRADALAVMAKLPVAGKVKTRLMPALSAAQAAEMAAALLSDQLVHLESVAAADLYLAFTPAGAQSAMEHLAPGPYRCFAQPAGDLGERMQGVLARLLDHGYARVVIIGGDLPAVPLRFFDEAYAFLNSSDQRVVLGPSTDGGYYLVGCNRSTPEIFMGMDWGHGRVLAHTVERLTALNIDYHLLPEWFDIDTPDDLTQLAALLATPAAATMPATANLLSRLLGTQA